jgi:hypothetical protein
MFIKELIYLYLPYFILKAIVLVDYIYTVKVFYLLGVEKYIYLILILIFYLITLFIAYRYKIKYLILVYIIPIFLLYQNIFILFLGLFYYMYLSYNTSLFNIIANNSKKKIIIISLNLLYFIPIYIISSENLNLIYIISIFEIIVSLIPFNKDNFIELKITILEWVITIIFFILINILILFFLSINIHISFMLIILSFYFAIASQLMNFYMSIIRKKQKLLMSI